MKYVLCLICLAFLPTGLSAQEDKFKAVAREVREDFGKAQEEKALTRAEMTQQRKALKKDLNRLKSQIKQENAALLGDEKRLEAMREERRELGRRIRAHTGHMKELDAIFRDFARDFSGLAERSPYSAEDPQRLVTLKDFLNKEKVLGIQDIRTLVELAFKDMAASSQVIMRKGTIVDRQGREVEKRHHTAGKSHRHIPRKWKCRLSQHEPRFRASSGGCFTRVGRAEKSQNLF